MYLPLALDMYNRPFIDSLGFMAIDIAVIKILTFNLPSVRPSFYEFGGN